MLRAQCAQHFKRCLVFQCIARAGLSRAFSLINVASVTISCIVIVVSLERNAASPAQVLSSDHKRPPVAQFSRFTSVRSIWDENQSYSTNSNG
jgi:hypothetical protein